MEFESLKKAVLLRAGDSFFNSLDGSTKQAIIQVFASQDAEGIKRLVSERNALIIEAIAVVLDDAAKDEIGVETSYYPWVVGLLQMK